MALPLLPQRRCVPVNPGLDRSKRLRTHLRQLFRPLAYNAAADPVVSTQWLAQNLEQVSLLDVRGHVDTILVEEGVEQSTYTADYDAYLDGHIPGAVFFDWTRDAIDMSADAPVQMQMQPDLLAAALEAKGVSHEKPVVAYDAGDGMLAARLWWMLTVAGHPDTLVLEGGWAKWTAEGRASELHEPCTLKVYSYFEPDLQPQLRTSIEDLKQLLQQSSLQQPQQQAVILDTRSAAQYTAQVRRGPRGGHIPGAISLPRPALVDESTYLFKPLEQQQQLLQAARAALPCSDSRHHEADIAEQKQVIVYCNGGVAACTAALALHRLGHRNWSVYDGSWNEYSRSDLPVAVP